MSPPLRDHRHSDGGLAALALALVAFSLFAVGDASSKLVVTESNAVIALWGRSVVFALLILAVIPPPQWKPTLQQALVKLLLQGRSCLSSAAPALSSRWLMSRWRR